MAINQVNANDSTSSGDTDIDGDALTYSCYYDTGVDGLVADDLECSSLSGVSFVIETGVMNWTPNNLQAGNFEFKISASDGNLSDVLIFTIEVISKPGNIWLSGDDAVNQSGVYGTKGEAATGNKPGGRFVCEGTIASNGDVYIFGGVGYDSTGTNGRLNDLWKYDVSEGMWIWLSGDDVVNQSGVYGTKGEAAAGNKPGGRNGTSGIMDSNGDFIIFGGNGYDSAGSSGPLNDLWKYDVSEGMWTWLSGDDVKNQSGVYGTKGVADIANKPGGRHSFVGMIDSNEDFIIFGGTGYNSSGTVGKLNDLWKLDIE